MVEMYGDIMQINKVEGTHSVVLELIPPSAVYQLLAKQLFHPATRSDSERGALLQWTGVDDLHRPRLSR